MPHAHTRERTVIHFPPRLTPDAAGVYLPPGICELGAMAAAVAPKALPMFVRDLMMSVRRHRYNPRWEALNRAGLVLALHCVERMLEEGVAVPEGERSRGDDGETVVAHAA